MTNVGNQIINLPAPHDLTYDEIQTTNLSTPQDFTNTIYDSDMDIEYCIEDDILIVEAEGNQLPTVENVQSAVEDQEHTEEQPKSITWSLNEEITVIDFYREHPSLYDIKTSEYKKSFKSSILDELAEMLDKKFTRNN